MQHQQTMPSTGTTNSSAGAAGDSIILTGSTGFLGSHLLARLLDRGDHQIVCFVRADSAAAARERGVAAFEESNQRSLTTAEAQRIRWQRADLEEELCGLSPIRWKALAAEVTEIYHCAASTRFDLPMAEAQRINVDGVIHLHALASSAAQHHTFQRFHHVSTAYASGRSSGLVGPDHLPADRTRNFRNTYEQTKARAERFLRAQCDVPVTIYRPSIVAGDSVSGRTTNWNVLYSPMRQIAKGRLPMLCHGGASIVDTIAIDVVADGMIALSRAATSRIAAFHLTAGPSAFTMRDFVDICNSATQRLDTTTAAPTQLVTMARWNVMTLAATLPRFAPKRFKRTRRRATIAHRALKGFAPYQPYTSVDCSFDTSTSASMLRDASVTVPDGCSYLRTVVAYALASDFGRVDVDGAAGMDADTDVAA